MGVFRANDRAVAVCLALVLGVAAIPAWSLASPGGGGAAISARAGHKAKHRCRATRRHHTSGRPGTKRRLCKRKRHQRPPAVEVPVTPPSPPRAAPSPPSESEHPVHPEEPEYPKESEYERIDLIHNNGFEETEEPTSCFEPFSASEGTVASTTTNPIAGAKSLAVSVSSFGRIGCIHDYPFEGGPVGKSVTVEGEVRIDSPGSGEGLRVCAIVYFANNPEPGKKCQTLPLADHSVAHVAIEMDTEGKRLQRVFFELEAGGTAIEATLDEVHLYVEALKGSGGPHGGPGEGGGGGGGGSNAGRFAAMVSPTDGETFTTPLNLRLVGIGHDPNIFTNVPVDGKGTNAAKVEFLLDGTPIYEQVGADAEYHVFKGFANDLDVAPGQHTVVARATFEDPALVLESDPVTITVTAPPAYAQTVNLTEDVVLGSNQSYELIGAPNARIRLNGNGHSILTPSGTSGHLTLKHVDVYNLGDPTDTSSPGVDVTVAGASGSVTIEDDVFDAGNPVDLRLNGASTAVLDGNLFRSNMRMPIGQQPGPDPNSPTVPVIAISGTSNAHKTFAGNNVGAAPVQFEHASNWTIGGTTDADSNVLIGPRASFEVLRSSDITIMGNFLDHVYYGGWSQGQLLELHETSPITVEHNVLVDSSWPVRGIAGEFAYNLVAEAGHEWLVPGDDAYIHHNVFVGGDADVGGITGFYDISARIENNTFDGQLGDLVHSALTWEDGQTTLRSNAFVGLPSSAAAAVDRKGGTIEAGYNGFFNPLAVDYLGGIVPANDLNGGASTNPRFAGPLPTTPFEGDRVAVWKRQLKVSEILSAYRARYTPTQGSPYIDAGDPAGGAGNDIGAIGAGTLNAADRFGSFAQNGWTPPSTPPAP